MEIRVDSGATETNDNTRKSLTLVDNAPEEAAKNIERSRLFDVSPDTYAGLKDQLDPEVKAIENVPDNLGSITKEYLGQSNQHRSLASENIKELDSIEKRVKYYKNQVFEIPKFEREANELVNKKITDGKLSEGEEEYLQNLELQIQDLQKESEGVTGLGDTEKFGVEVLSATGDFFRSYWENKELLAVGVGGGTAVAALGGSIIPGLGTVTAGGIGFTKSMIATSTFIGFKDAYTQTRASTYRELTKATDKQGNPLNIPEERIVTASKGVAILSGIAGGLAGKVLSSNNPFLKKFASPKLASKLLTSNAATMAKMEVLGSIVKSVGSEGAEESFQELVQIVGKNFAKMDDSESSFMNALEQSLTDAQTWSQVAKAGAVGGATGGVIQTVTGAPGYSGLKKRYDEIQTVAKKRAEVLETQNNLVEIAKDIKDTKIQKYAPAEMGEFTRKVFSTLGVDEKVWFTLDSLREFSNTPEKGEAVRKAIDPTGDLTKMAKELNTPVEMNKGDLLQIITEFPELSEHMRLTPDGESPLEVRNNARNFNEKLIGAASKREELLAGLGVDEPVTPEIQAQLDELSKLADEQTPYTGRNDYIESQTFTEIDGIMTKEEAEVWNTTHLDAKRAVDEALTQDNDEHYQKIEDRIFKDVDSKDIQNQIAQLDKEFKILENFEDKTVNATTVEHKKKGFSQFAIDPRSLPEDLKEIYIENETLYKRKVFVHGGISVEESAALNGVESGAELLKLLSETPTKDQIKNDREQRQIELRNRIQQTIKPSKDSKRDKAFTDLTKIHIKEMEHLRTKEWPTVKRGIIKIVSKVPTVESLNIQAKETVSKMKIKQLNANTFKVGETVSQKAAVKNFLNAEFEQAFANKEKAALNNEMRKEVLNAKEKVAKFEGFWKKVAKPNIQQELKDAGMLDVMEEFTSVYRLDGNTKGQNEQKSFNAWVKKQAENGGYVPVIPERLDNTQVSSKELTVEQYQAITEFGQYLVHQAKLKNKLLKSNEARVELQTAEAIAEKIDTTLKEHPNYDESKIKKENERYLSFTEKIHNGLKTSISAVSSIKTIVAELDNYKLNGQFHELIGKPIKEARSAKRQEMLDIETQDKAIIEKFYGMDKFKEMFNEFINVPEFNTISSLGDGEGNIRKIDLLVLQAYIGDPEGKDAIKNFITKDNRRLTVEEVQIILDRELTSKDASFVQNFLINRFKRFEQRSFDLHKKTTGIEAEMIKGVPVLHKGKILPGGYYPIKRQMISDEVRATKFLDKLFDRQDTLSGEDESGFYTQMRSAEMTKQGRLKERTGSDRPLDITFENVFDFTEEAIHDLNFREVGIDTLKILKDPVNVKNMKSVIGNKKFVSLLNSVKDIVSKTTERESTLFAEESNWVNQVIQKAHSLHAVKAIGLNLTSAAIQADSLSNLMLRVGPKTGLYLSKTAFKISKNISNYNEYVKMAEAINPDIKFEKDGIDNAIIKQSNDYIPSSTTFFKNYKSKSGKTIAKIRDIQKQAIDASFFLVRESDRFNKVLTTLAISEQFLNGDVDGYSKEKLATMSDTEKAEAMKAIVQQSIDLSLTANAPEDRTALEKNKVASIFVRYWTDRRSRLNSTLAQVDKIKGNIKKGDNAKAVGNVLTLMLAAGASAAFVNMIRGKEELIKGKLKDEDDVIDFGKDLMWSFAKAPINQTLDTIPIIDNIKYQSELDLKSDYRTVSAPLFGVYSDVAMGVVALKEVLEMGRKASLGKVQRAALLHNAGYIVGGAPTNSFNKVLNALDSKEVKKGTKYLKEDIQALHKEINLYIDAFKDNKEAEPFIEDLKEYQKTLPQYDNDVKHIIPENIKEVISSGNKWNKLDMETGAVGTYQFTEERWNELMALNPDLGLTENGRVAKDQTQQEKAIEWVIQDNTRNLLAYDLPVNNETLYGAHKFGFDNFISIYSSKDDVKLSELLGDEVNNPVFDKFKTVKDVKKYLNSVVKK